MAMGVESWLQQHQPSHVHWLEMQVGRRGTRATMVAAPVEVGSALQSQLWDQVRSVILTSATLSSGPDANFDFLRSRLGLIEADSVQVGSPFDYATQMELVIVPDMPDPGREPAAYEQQTIRMVQRYVQKTEGRAFVLFTSYASLKRVSSALTPWLTSQRITPLIHGDGTPERRSWSVFGTTRGPSCSAPIVSGKASMCPATPCAT